MRFKVPVNEDGRRVWREMEEFDTSIGVHANWPERFFARLVDTYCANDRQPRRQSSAMRRLSCSTQQAFSSSR